jgi:hypothetical protein
MAALLLAGERMDAREGLRAFRFGEIGRCNDLRPVKERHAASVDPQFLTKAGIVQGIGAVASL